jgi:hypothetical protein
VCGVHCAIYAGPGAHPVGREQALLEFYDPERPSTPLRFGDTVSLYPDGVNGLMVYAGSNDGRAWVEILKPTATTPPNMRDCHFRIRPRAQYGEAKRLQKLLKEGNWDGGRNLPLPDVPDENADLDEVAERRAPARVRLDLFRCVLTETGSPPTALIDRTACMVAEFAMIIPSRTMQRCWISSREWCSPAGYYPPAQTRPSVLCRASIHER